MESCILMLIYEEKKNEKCRTNVSKWMKKANVAMHEGGSSDTKRLHPSIYGVQFRSSYPGLSVVKLFNSSMIG